MRLKKLFFFLFGSMSAVYSPDHKFSPLLTLSMHNSTQLEKTTKRHNSRSSPLSILTLFVNINTFEKSQRDVTYSQLFKEMNLSFAVSILSTHGSFVDHFLGYNVRNGMNPSIPMILRSSSSESEAPSSSSLSSFLSF